MSWIRAVVMGRFSAKDSASARATKSRMAPGERSKAVSIRAITASGTASWRSSEKLGRERREAISSSGAHMANGDSHRRITRREIG